MKNIVILLIISLIPAFFACEKTIHIDIPDNDPKPVAQAFLSPDDEYINVFLTWSVPLYHEFDWSFKDITDADVYIIKNSNNSPQNTKTTFPRIKNFQPILFK